MRDFGYRQVSMTEGRIVFEVDKSGEAFGQLFALVAGIQIGKSEKFERLSIGSPIIVRVDKFPLVSLPCEVRFATEDGVEAAEPLIVTTASDVVRLIGPGELSCGPLRVENGVVRGTVCNRVNGILAPTLIANVNDVLKHVHIGALKVDDEGGYTCPISLDFHGSDFMETGCIVKIYSLPNFALLAQIQFRRVEKDALAETVLRLQSEFSKQKLLLQNETAKNRRYLDESLSKQRALLESAIEYFAMLCYDKSASLDRAAAGMDRARLSPTIQSFYETIRSAQLKKVKENPCDVVYLAPNHASFGDDWWGVEINGGLMSRWMPKVGSFFNPTPDRRVVGVVISVLDYMGSSPPALFIDSGGESMVAGELFGRQDGRNLHFRFDFHLPVLFGIAYLISSTALSPKVLDHTSEDERILSVNVTGIRIFYEVDPVESIDDALL